LSKLQAEAAGTLWSVCIAHPTNKQKVPTRTFLPVTVGTNGRRVICDGVRRAVKAADVVPALVGLIKHETYEPTLRYAGTRGQQCTMLSAHSSYTCTASGANAHTQLTAYNTRHAHMHSVSAVERVLRCGEQPAPSVGPGSGSASRGPSPRRIRRGQVALRFLFIRP
jgi:hypothetical protein